MPKVVPFYRVISIKKKILDSPNKKILKNIKFNPVFILGLHRSGTTILYEILAKTGRLNRSLVPSFVSRIACTKAS